MAELDYKYWQQKLEKEKKAHDCFRKEAKKAESAARDDDDSKKQAFNIQWANNKILLSAIYAARPKPDVRRRYQKPDPEERELARMVERAIEYQLDTSHFDASSRAAVKDFVTVGLGVPRVYMDVQTTPMTDPMTGEPVMDEEGEPVEEIVSQNVGVEHVPWNHFHWEPGKAWESVDWVAFQSFRPKKELEEEYDVEIKAGKDEDAKRDSEEYADEVQVYEIWHKPTRQVFVYAPTHPVLLEVRDDTLDLQEFFPSPRPMFANLKSDELQPKPDYCFIEGQIVELNRLTQRIKAITKQIKVLGYYDAANKELGSLMSSPDGTYKPIDGLNGKTEYNPEKAMVHLPLIEKIQVLRELQGQREETKQQIYEIIGISDIVRGASKASETAAAQNIKGQWANVRLSEKTGEVARVFRDVFRMFAEIICEHFQPEVLMLQTGVELTPRMIQTMKSDIGRSFAIDVETDSTIAKDDYEDRQQTMEMIDTILAKMQEVIPAVQAGLLPVTFVQETLLMIVSKHKHGKQLEDAIMELAPHLQNLQQFQQQMQQMQMQLQQTQAEAQQAVAQRDQQLQEAGNAIKGLQGKLEQFNGSEERRKDIELQIKDRESKSKMRRDFVETEAQQIENQAIAQKLGIEIRGDAAEVRETMARTDKLRKETALMGIA